MSDMGDSLASLSMSISLSTFNFQQALEEATRSFEAFSKRVWPILEYFSHAKSLAYARSIRNSPQPHGFLRLSRGRGMSTQNRKVNKHGRIGIDRRVHR